MHHDLAIEVFNAVSAIKSSISRDYYEISKLKGYHSKIDEFIFKSISKANGRFVERICKYDKSLQIVSLNNFDKKTGFLLRNSESIDVLNQGSDEKRLIFYIIDSATNFSRSIADFTFVCVYQIFDKALNGYKNTFCIVTHGGINSQESVMYWDKNGSTIDRKKAKINHRLSLQTSVFSTNNQGFSTQNSKIKYILNNSLSVTVTNSVVRDLLLLVTNSIDGVCYSNEMLIKILPMYIICTSMSFDVSVESSFFSKSDLSERCDFILAQDAMVKKIMSTNL